jgi:hyperosmotically inducible protein
MPVCGGFDDGFNARQRQGVCRNRTPTKRQERALPRRCIKANLTGGHMNSIDPRQLHAPLVSGPPTSPRLIVVAVAACAFVALAACSPADREEVRDRASQTSQSVSNEVRNAAADARSVAADASLTARVKSVLLADAQVKGTAIDVDTREGTVILTGKVDSMSTKLRAEELAQGVEGVKSVRNQLTTSGG